MRRFQVLTSAVLLFLAAPPASADYDWFLWCGGTKVSGLSGGQIACAAVTSASIDTKVISVGACENIDVTLFVDKDGNGTGATSLTQLLQECPEGESDGFSGAERDAACVAFSNGTLVGTNNNGDKIQGGGTGSGFIKLQSGGSIAGDPYVFVKCNGPSR